MKGFFNNRWGWKKTKNGNIMIRLMIKQDNEEHPHRIFIQPKQTRGGTLIMLQAAELIFRDNKFSHSVSSEPTWFRLKEFKQLIEALKQMMNDVTDETEI